MKLHWLFYFLPALLFSCNTAEKEPPPYNTEIPILSSDFSGLELKPRWFRTGLPDDLVDTIGAAPDGKIRLATPETIKSPPFEVEPLRYYRLTLRATATHRTFWAVVFFDEVGAMLPADIYSTVDPSETSRDHTFYFQSKADAVTAQFWVRPFEEHGNVTLERVEITPATGPAAIKAWADSVYQTIPPLGTVETANDRDRFIPRTMEALQKGEKVRVVMLGNSIINDTGNSAWEILTEADYPGADIEVITSVRGGTGCWYYQENNRVDTFVVRYQPDLLIIGGISHRNDTAAIRRVIDQVRERTDAEILVFSGPVGRDGDPRSNPDFALPPEPGDFRLQLQDMAQAANVGYWDMKTEWGRYIRDSGQPYDFYLRDPVHANARGRQVLARLMRAYFAPEE
jgi:hypothetical protein